MNDTTMSLLIELAKRWEESADMLTTPTNETHDDEVRDEMGAVYGECAKLLRAAIDADPRPPGAGSLDVEALTAVLQLSRRCRRHEDHVVRLQNWCGHIERSTDEPAEALRGMAYDALMGKPSPE